MKLKNNVSEKTLRKRVLIAFGALGFFLIIIIFAFKTMRSTSEDEAYKIHRKFFHFNEKLWSNIFSKHQLSVKKPTPAKNKAPRVNGSLGLKSLLNLANYKIEIESGIKKFSLTTTDFLLLPKVDYTTDFRCIEGWSEETQYAGARFSDFMEAYKVGKKTDGVYYKYVGFETPDKEYYVSIDMDSMLHPQTVLAYEMNQAPLKIENGFPLRLIIPIKYGIKSLKRIGRIFFSDSRPPDYWAERGYDWYSGL